MVGAIMFRHSSRARGTQKGNVESAIVDGERDQDLALWVEQEYESLLRFGILITGSSEGAEDLVEETFARIYRARRRVRSRGLHWYSREIMVNLARSDARHKVASRRLKQMKATRDVESDPMMRAVLALSPLQRVCLALRYYEHRTDNEISSICSIGTGAVNRQIHRALKQIGSKNS